MDTMTPKEAAQVLDKSRKTLYRWIERGWIKAEQWPNGEWRIPRDEIERLKGAA